MSQINWNFSDNSPKIGFVLSATGLYFFLVCKWMGITSGFGAERILVDDSDSGTSVIMA